jgi:hypothetical protein
MSDQLARAALEYAARGWPVFPIQRCGKIPLTEHGFQDASTDPTTIHGWWKRWPAANIGVATGARSGLVVLDVDAGKGGFDSLRNLMAAVPGPALLTLVAGTGGGGIHLFYRHPNHPVTNSAKRLRDTYGPGLDVRGDGGYVVVAPSVHPSGRRYEWQSDPHSIEPWPAWLQAIITGPQPLSPDQPPRPIRLADRRRARTDFDFYWRMVLDRRLEVLDQTSSHRNEAMNDAAFRMGQLIALGAPEDEIRAILIEAGEALRARGWADSCAQLEATVDSGLAGGQAHPDRWVRGQGHTA